MAGHVYKCPDCGKLFKVRQKYVEHITAYNCLLSPKTSPRSDATTKVTSDKDTTNSTKQNQQPETDTPVAGTSSCPTPPPMEQVAEPHKSSSQELDGEKSETEHSLRPSTSSTSTSAVSDTPKTTTLANDVVGPILAAQQKPPTFPPARILTQPAVPNRNPHIRKNASDPRCSTTKINRGPGGALRRVSFPGVNAGESVMSSKQDTKPGKPHYTPSGKSKRPFKYHFPDSDILNKGHNQKASASQITGKPDVTDPTEKDIPLPPAKKLKESPKKSPQKKGSQGQKRGPQIPPPDLFIPGKASSAPKTIPLDCEEPDKQDQLSDASSSTTSAANLLEQQLSMPDIGDLNTDLHLSDSDIEASPQATETSVEEKWLDTINLINNSLSKLTAADKKDINQGNLTALLDAAMMIINLTD